MISTIYIEESVIEHARTIDICERYAAAEKIIVERYGEVFNSHAQNFRLQKSNPALILAEKKNKRILSTPAQYETGGGANYYFSHMLNCIYDCRYCFLQGMYRSANYLLFVNYEDFVNDLREIADDHKHDSASPWFFSGYDCDSLALEPVSRFAEHFLSEFENIPHATLELRTKSTQVRSLLARPALQNVVVAFSLSPASVAEAIEIGAPPLNKRLSAMLKLQQAGWRIGVRFDPVIWHQDHEENYRSLIDQVFKILNPDNIDSVTLGAFRLPKGYFKTMRKLYPEHWLFSAGLQDHQGMITYTQEIETEMFTTISAQLAEYMQADKIYAYPGNTDDMTALVSD